MKLRYRLLAITVLFPLLSNASELELTVNGDIELPLAVGWEVDAAGEGLSIMRGNNYDHDPDVEVNMVCDEGYGEAFIQQLVILPETNVHFSVELSTMAEDGATAWCVAGLMITYRDGGTAPVGRTFLGSRSPNCIWESDGDFHLIDTTEDWNTWSFWLNDELENLPAVDPARVHSIELKLYIFADNC